MDLSKVNKKKWVLVMKTEPNKMNGYIPFQVFVRDVFYAEMRKTSKGYEKAIKERAIENRKYLELDDVTITDKDLDNILISNLTDC